MMTNWKIPLASTVIGEDEIDAVSDVLRSGWITSGERTAQFEAAFAAKVMVDHALAVSNCTMALQLAYRALGVGPGDDVIVPSLTFVATANAAHALGARVIFCDVCSEHDLTIDPSDIQRKLTERTKAISVVHYAGYAAQMDDIVALAQGSGVSIIEDCAHAPGATYRGVPLGSIGKIGCFSFFGNKNITTGEGGMITTNDSDLAAQIRLLRSHGMTTGSWDRFRGHAFSYDVEAAGYNARFDDMRAALGLAQLHRLDEINRRRGELVRRYRSLLSKVDGLTIPFLDRDESAFHLFVVILPLGVSREQVMKCMAAEGVQTSIHYPPVHQFSIYAKDSGAASLPRLDSIASRILTLPLFPQMSEANVDMVADTLIQALGNADTI
ncbi:dTDP-4-amino-4,6-dideoxygalactose transaminase [Agrobacterium vitis]|nr:dTDP-4-amino-4,6-dideoxygalactose transaminase [Agrobacterium vitis]MBE1436627.1 dTDP-4-amino-4,6-dideoxygalactose transaminase [Agrobacterium vitis]